MSEIRALSARLDGASDRELRERTDDLRGRYLIPQPYAANHIVELFALVNQALRRRVGFEFYDVQFLAGLAMTDRCVAEVATGEGKTLITALPAALHALRGTGLHVGTVNDYLAARDFAQLQPVYETLGLSVGLLESPQTDAEKRAAYDCDITYGPAHEFGFDYLRDQVARRQATRGNLGAEFSARLLGSLPGERRSVQRGLHAVIVDEIDSVLIDDAASPLVIGEYSPFPAPDSDVHRAALNLANDLQQDAHFVVDGANRLVELTDAGHTRIYEGFDQIPTASLQRTWTEYVNAALRARYVLRRDVDFVVQDGEVHLVDQSTGRIHAERKWQSGMHQAVEAREGVTITADRPPLARITRQRLYRQYKFLCGMTGTTVGAETEFSQVFQLAVRKIPLHKGSQRHVRPAAQFATLDHKWAGIVDEIVAEHKKQRPVLIGTRSISESELLARKLQDRGLEFSLLNGRQDKDEADIVAAAGRSGAITVATNMAGRGTDIRLGDRVPAAGGLHVIATGHHESRRVDRQLIGRCARQGDPGSSRIFVSAEDLMIRRYSPSLSRAMQHSASDAGRISRQFGPRIAALQKWIEKKHYRLRRQLLESDRQRDDVMARLVGPDSPSVLNAPTEESQCSIRNRSAVL